MFFLRTFLPLLSVLLVELSKVVYADTQIHDDSFVPDGILHVSSGLKKQSCVPTKDILLVNGTSPGPELRFKEGQTVWIRVFNDIPDQNLTMHWHGLTMATAPFSDGTPAAAQWPIPPNHFFDYELHVQVGMAGTYFYHSHVGLQALSATGPLIVEEENAPYCYDADRIVFLQDVFPDDDAFVEHALLASPMAYERAQEMVLINGKGGGLTSEEEFCNDTLSVINVNPGKTYRLRLIGGTGLAIVTLGIEGHKNLEVIEADAAYTEKHNTSFMQVAPGQRFSVLLHTKSKPDKQRYFLQVESREFGNLTRSYAVINYGPPINSSTTKFYPPTSPPLTLPPTDSAFLEYTLRPHHNSTDLVMPTAADVTRRVHITVRLNITNQGGLIYDLNGYPWLENSVEEPYLVSLYKNDGNKWPSIERALKNDGLDPKTLAFPALLGEVLEIVIENTGSPGYSTETHPWHAHGAHYWDLGSGDGVYDPIANEIKWANSIGKPMKRDTTMVYKYSGHAAPGVVKGWRVWRLRVTQPGVWMIHCHLLPHMVWGMQTAWVMGNATEVLDQVPRPDVEGYLAYGGSVMGNETHSPEVVEFFNAWTESQ
ncbi:multicopper oxidase-domain-containing protein [Tricladium varicosporioides]|nr:multicopper oxidase-domain-containing protein [Hymenoscyphus varicosporioides]